MDVKLRHPKNFNLRVYDDNLTTRVHTVNVKSCQSNTASENEGEFFLPTTVPINILHIRNFSQLSTISGHKHHDPTFPFAKRPAPTTHYQNSRISSLVWRPATSFACLQSWVGLSFVICGVLFTLFPVDEELREDA